MRDWSPRLRMNAAACVKARQDYGTQAQAYFEIHGQRLPSFDELPVAHKHRLASEEFARMQSAGPRPVPVIGKLSHLADALDAADDMQTALQDALRSSESTEDTLAVLTFLEQNADFMARLCQFRNGVPR